MVHLFLSEEYLKESTSVGFCNGQYGTMVLLVGPIGDC